MTHDPLDAHLDALGDALGRGVARAERRRRRTLRAAGASGTLVAVGLGALVLLPGGRELDPVAQARAAVAERGSGVLHYIARQEFRLPPGSNQPQQEDFPAMEVWTTTVGEDHYRVRSPADGRARYCGIVTFMPSRPSSGLARRLTGPMLTSPMDTAKNGHTTTTYSSWSRAAVVRVEPRQAPAGMSSFTATPAFGNADPRDPVRAIRSALRTGALRDGGTVTVDGRVVRKLVGRAGPSRRRCAASSTPSTRSAGAGVRA